MEINLTKENFVQKKEMHGNNSRIEDHHLPMDSSAS